MENPLAGAFNRERTMLIFRQTADQVWAAYGAAALGASLFVRGLWLLLVQRRDLDGVVLWLITFGFLFLAAAFWAFSLFRSFKFDLRKRTYAERFGASGRPVHRTGSISEIRHLELMPYGGLFGTVGGPGSVFQPDLGGQVYVIRLVWHDQRRIPAILEHVNTAATYGTVDARLADFGHKAMQYAQAIGVPMYTQVPLPGLQRIS